MATRKTLKRNELDRARPLERLTSGKYLHNPKRVLERALRIKKSTLWGKRFTELTIAYVSDKGGPETITTAQLAIIQRAAALQTYCEELDVKMANGTSVDISEYKAVSDTLRRLLDTLGMHRDAKDITPDLEDYVECQLDK